MKKWKKLLIIFVSAALLVGAVLVLKPRYDAFIERDNIETCYDAMYWIGIWYHLAIQEKLENGESEQDINYEELLRKVIAAHYVITVDDNLESGDFCRAGGNVKFFIDTKTHRLSVSCDAPMHHNFSDEFITEGFIGELQNVSSGLN